MLPGAQRAVVGQGGLAVAGDHGHALAVALVAADGALDVARQRIRQAPDKRQVGAVQVARGESGGQRVVGQLRLGDHHDAGGVLVQPVHDARAALAADAGERVAAMGEQGVDQGAVLVAGRGVHDQPGRLVEHDQVGVLVEDR